MLNRADWVWRSKRRSDMRSDNNQIYIEILFHLLNVGLNNVELDATRINRLSEGDWDATDSSAGVSISFEGCVRAIILL